MYTATRHSMVQLFMIRHAIIIQIAEDQGNRCNRLYESFQTLSRIKPKNQLQE